MGNDRDVTAAFDIIEGYLRSKGHDVHRDDTDGHLHIAISGVIIDHLATAGICVTVANERGRQLMLAALAELEVEPPHAEIVDQIRRRLASSTALTTTTDSWTSYIDLPDCSGCDLPCDLLDALGHLGHCDLPCDVPGCDL